LFPHHCHIVENFGGGAIGLVQMAAESELRYGMQPGSELEGISLLQIAQAVFP
jgi:hypothetical protein